MNKFKAALVATGVVIAFILFLIVAVLFQTIVIPAFIVGGTGLIWWTFYKAFKD